MDVWARPSREEIGNGEPWIKARVTPVLVIEMSRKSLGGWRARYSRGWQKDVSAQGDGEPHVLGTEVATFCQKMGQSGKRTKHAPLIRLMQKSSVDVIEKRELPYHHASFHRSVPSALGAVRLPIFKACSV